MKKWQVFHFWVNYLFHGFIILHSLTQIKVDALICNVFFQIAEGCTVLPLHRDRHQTPASHSVCSGTGWHRQNELSQLTNVHKDTQGRGMDNSAQICMCMCVFPDCWWETLVTSCHASQAVMDKPGLFLHFPCHCLQEINSVPSPKVSRWSNSW